MQVPRRLSVRWLMGAVVLAALLVGLAREQQAHQAIDNEVAPSGVARRNLAWYVEQAALCQEAQDQGRPYNVKGRNQFRQMREREVGVAVDTTIYGDWASEQASHAKAIAHFRAEIEASRHRKREAQHRLLIPFS